MARYDTKKYGKYERVRILRQARDDVLSGDISRQEYHDIKTELGGYRADVPSEKAQAEAQLQRFQATQPVSPVRQQKVETGSGSFLLQVNQPARDIQGRTKTDFLIEQRKLEREQREAEDIGKRSILYLGEQEKPKKEVIAEQLALRTGLGASFGFQVRNVPLSERVQFKEPVYIGVRAEKEPSLSEKMRREGEKSKEKAQELYNRGKFSSFESIKGSGQLIKAGATQVISDPISLGSAIAIGTGLTLLSTKNPVLAGQVGTGLTWLYGLSIGEKLLKKETTVEQEIGSIAVLYGTGKVTNIGLIKAPKIIGSLKNIKNLQINIPKIQETQTFKNIHSKIAESQIKGLKFSGETYKIKFINKKPFAYEPRIKKFIEFAPESYAIIEYPKGLKPELSSKLSLTSFTPPEAPVIPIRKPIITFRTPKGETSLRGNFRIKPFNEYSRQQTELLYEPLKSKSLTKTSLFPQILLLKQKTETKSSFIRLQKQKQKVSFVPKLEFIKKTESLIAFKPLTLKKSIFSLRYKKGTQVKQENKQAFVSSLSVSQKVATSTKKGYVLDTSKNFKIQKNQKLKSPTFKFKLPKSTPYNAKGFRRSFKYAPSLTAFTFKLYGKVNEKKTYSGFELRPLPRGFKI